MKFKYFYFYFCYHELEVYKTYCLMCSVNLMFMSSLSAHRGGM